MKQGRPILAVGAANAERLLKVREVRPGGKTVIPPATLAAGGSAVNHACRLIAAGIPARLVVPIGEDYPAGLVRQVVMEAANTGAATAEFQHQINVWFRRVMCAGATTAHTTVLVDSDGQRTLFSETASASVHFRDLCSEIVRELPASEIAGLIVGHIHADAAQSEEVPYGCSGQITSSLLSHFHGRVPVVLNLGRSQYRLGVKRWLDEIGQADIFQATYDEAVEFITAHDPGQRSLRDVARWFQKKRITAVITIDKLGALGVMKTRRATRARLRGPS